jgi:NADP-dependent 3-hydroxy acid dehydrogenase YdfG
VTDHDAVARAVNQAYGRFGRLDVVLSNAGYALISALEETVEEAWTNFETNVIGTFSVVQAALPLIWQTLR